MSHLNFPRAHFHGTFVANICTANNDDIVRVVDAANITVDTQGRSDEEFSKWLMDTTPSGQIRGGWNLFGDGSCSFRETRIVGVERQMGHYEDDPDRDSLIGARVRLGRAVMVDVDPEGTYGTQIFCDRFRIAKSSPKIRLGGPTTRFYSRWVWNSARHRRNLSEGGFTAFSAVWHAAIAAEDFDPEGTGSLLVECLKEAKDEGKGLFIRFCTYLLKPRISQAVLAERFADGDFDENPAIGFVTGSIGVHEPEELHSFSAGRMLHAAASIVSHGSDYDLGPAVAKLDRASRTLTVDLINTVPERDDSLAKADVGELSVGVLVESEGPPHFEPIGKIEYDRETYRRLGGIQSFQYSEALVGALEDGKLAIFQNESGAAVLAETDSVIETDDRGIYLQEGEKKELEIRLSVRGELPQAVTTITLRQLVTANKVRAPATPENRVVAVAEEIEVGTDGVAKISLEGVRPGCCLVIFSDSSVTQSDIRYFTNIRVLPKDNYDGVPDDQLTFELIYQEVLRYYHLLTPAMSSVFDLSDKEEVTENAEAIKKRISKELWDRWKYMSRLRELSHGKRKLLERWCARVLSPRE